MIIEGNQVNYDFHGGGCTFYWNEIEIFYNTDAASKHQIMVGEYGMIRFIDTLKPIGLDK